MKPVSSPSFLNEACSYANPVPFSRGVRIDLPGFALVAISGTASVGPGGESLHEGDFKAQARRMLANITALLASEGATWKDVFKTTIFLKDMGDYEAFAKIRMAHFREHGVTVYPASTCVQATLCRQELLCEMEAMALLRHDQKADDTKVHSSDAALPNL